MQVSPREHDYELWSSDATEMSGFGVGDQLIPHVFAHMIRRFPWGTTAAAAAGYLGTTVGTPACNQSDPWLTCGVSVLVSTV